MNDEPNSNIPKSRLAATQSGALFVGLKIASLRVAANHAEFSVESFEHSSLTRH
jgi:hypothetical protein